MANTRLYSEYGEYPHDTTKKNEEILSKLRARGKIDNKTPDEWTKLFHQLNTKQTKKYSKDAKQSALPRPDQELEPIYGPISGFPSGSWWGIRMDCSRDRVHSPFNKDIQEGRFGVASICTSHTNNSNDVDLGTFLTYTGGEYKSGKSRDSLMKNLQNQIPLRLVRSYNLTNKFAPKAGYRYDGLYIVASTWIATSGDKNYYKYALARVNCQDPPPWALPLRTSTRLSSAMKNCTAKIGCGSIKCHIYGCETAPESEKRKKQIILERSPATKKPKITDNPRITGENVIVNRHLTKKTDHAESPVLQNNLLLPCSPKPPAFKLQNTNISIRTELYDSTPNQQEPKKSTPMTFCRIYKSNTVPSKSNCTNNSFNFNNKNQDSQVSPSRLPKVTVSPILSNNNNNNSSNPLPVVKDQCSIKSNNSTPNNFNIAMENLTKPSSVAANHIEFSNTESKDRPVSLEKYQTANESTFQRSLSRRSSTASHSSTDSLITKLHLPEAIVAIESMTPEQMLNLIVKKRHKATGKLLIGSIIGLPIDDPTDMSVNNVEILQKSIETDNHSENTQVTVVESNSTAKSMNKSTFYQTSMTKIRNENKERGLKSMRLKRTRVPRALAELEGSCMNRNKNSSKLLNKTHSSEKVVQPFSKSTVPKKRRSELANLAIDANFGTNIRGHKIQTRTMSRQLRGPKIILSKRKEFSGFITNYSRFDLSKKSKRLAGANKTRIPKTRHVKTKKNDDDHVKSVARPVNKVKEQSSTCRTDKSTKISEIRKSERTKSQMMVDAMIQCTLQQDTLTSVAVQTQPMKIVKIECIDLVNDIKSESSDSDAESYQEIVYQDCEVQTTEELTKNMVNLHVNQHDNELSAFVPVNLSESDPRVARLRLIGFKPIETPPIPEGEEFNMNIHAETRVNASGNVIKRNVDEQYNKYTSEENNIVKYMDNELHYEDIEAEAITTQKITGIICKHEYKKRNTIKGKLGQTLIRRRKYSSSSSSSEDDDDDDDEEIPWHGWATVHTNR